MSTNQNNSSSGSIYVHPSQIITSGGWYGYHPAVTDPGDLSADDGAVPVAEKKINKDGCSCKKCKEFYPYAQANQDDGTLICYACRKGW